MKKEFEEYLKDIGIVTQPLLERSEAVLEALTELAPEGYSDIVVSDNLRGDGNRDYLALWAFSKNYLMEARNFIDSRQDDVDYASIEFGIQYLRVLATAYNFKEATPQSRLYCQFDARAHNVSGELRAAGNNCPYLWKCIKKYLIKRPSERGRE